MAAAHLAYPDLAVDKFPGTDPDQDAETCIQLIERKINFALRDAPGDAGELENYTFRKKALFSSLLRGPAADCYESNITNATTWENVRTNFITRFSDGRNKFRYRLEVEHCIRGDGEEIRNFLHRIKRTVDKGWPDDLNGIEAAHHNAEREAQGRQWRQRYMDYSLRGLRPRYLQRKAQEFLMERPNATWNDFCAQIIQKDLILEVSSTFLSHEAQTKAELATFGQEIKKTSIKIERISHQRRSNIFMDFLSRSTGRQKVTRFCNYCHKNGHTLNWRRKKMRDEKVRKIRNDMSSKRIISPMKNSSTEQFNRRPPGNNALNDFLDLDDRNSPSIERLSNEEANWQHEDEPFTPPNEDSFQGTMA